MATGSLLRTLQRATRTSSTLNFPFSNPNRLISHHAPSVSCVTHRVKKKAPSVSSLSQCLNPWKWVFRNFSHGRISSVLSQGKPKFETHEEYEPPKKKWNSKKKFKMQLLREKTKRKSANKKDPRNLRVRQTIWAKIKEALLTERLKRYEVPKAQGHRNV